MKRYMISVALAAGLGSAAGVQAAPVGCMIMPERVAEVGSPTIGIVKSMLVERGDPVRKGQVIAVLDDEVERASLVVALTRAQASAEIQAAQAGFDLAEQRRIRAEELYSKQFISAQARDQAVAEAVVAEQKLHQAREQRQAMRQELALAKARLKERVIRSPFDGVVAERYFSAGERVEEKPMVRVAKVDPLRVEVVMTSNMFGRVQPGTPARVMPELPGIGAIQAEVALVDQVLDAASNTFRVRLLVPNPGGKVPAGLRCKIDFAQAATTPKM